MDWITSLAAAMGITLRQQKQQEQRLADELGEHCLKIEQAAAGLSSVLKEVFTGCGLSMDAAALSDAEELIPLYPFAEVLSAQGFIGEAQEEFLRAFLVRSGSRYNLHQFVTLAVERGEPYSEWCAQTLLGPERCGKVWHTLIEAICRMRCPDTMQRVVDGLGAVLYRFWFLSDPSAALAKPCYDRIINSLNEHAERDQRQPYLHAVMLLQMELAARCGGTAQEYEPVLKGEPVDMDGVPGYRFFVCRHGEPAFRRWFAVRLCRAPGKQPDLIWELPPCAPPTVFFSE